MAETSGVQIPVRQAQLRDVPELVRLNRLAYPTMAEENVVWGEPHLRSHLRQFPPGQLVAEIEGRLAGACSSLIVNLGPDPLRPHTWAGITDSGYFTNHDPTADTLYGADVYVHPDFWGMGVGKALYDARKELCGRLNLRRILAGGRLWNYVEHADVLTPEEYAARVIAGDLRDKVLSFQLRQGFIFRGILRNYIRDPRSHNCASLIEWLNPDYVPSEPGQRKIRVACVQYGMRQIRSFDDFARQVSYFADVAADYRSEYILFPELFSLQLLSSLPAMGSVEGVRRLAEMTPQFLDLMSDLARRYGLNIIAGSHPVLQPDGKVHNIAHVCLPDGSVYGQAKLHITPSERRWWGISGGSELHPIPTPQARIGVLICYDVEFPEAARYLADMGAEIIFVPYCTDNRQGYLRVRYCAAARAIENQIYLALSGNVGNLPDVENMDINYAQAAVLTPSDFAFSRDGVKAESEFNEETVLICDLDLDDLHRARTGGTVTPRLDRRTDLFQVISPLKGPPKPKLSTEPGPLGELPQPDPRE